MTRDELYQAVWSSPMVKLAKNLEVSGSYLARVCTVLNVPRPERGYWAKLQAGARAKVPALPLQRAGEPLEWSKETGFQGMQRPTGVAHVDAQASRKGKASGSGTHPVINGARKHFESGRPVDDGIFLKPYKKLLVDITTSAGALVEALSIANEFFNALESRGYRVALAPHAPHANGLGRPELDWHEVAHEPKPHYPTIWTPGRPTIVYVGDVAIGVALLEMAEPVLMRYVSSGKYIRESDYVPPKLRRGDRDWSWTTTKDMPTGRFRLQLYAPYRHVSWQKHWQDTKSHSIKKQIPSIVNEMRTIGDELMRLVAEADREAEIRRLEWDRERELIRRRNDRLEIEKSVRVSQEGLNKLIEAWIGAENTRRFFDSIEQSLRDLPEEMRKEALDRVALAKEFAGTSSPWNLLLEWRTPHEIYSPRYPQDESDE